MARLLFCELVHLLAVINAAALHLLVKRDAMETHIGADWLCHGAVMFMRLRDDAFTIPKAMTHSVGHGAILSEMSDYGAVLTPAASPSRDLGLLFHRERL